ncbi:hypothetical protein I7I53_12261 [Histoplasma capsulatum var. duboisii H88]|uniref:Uncharacterized protein n=1 Tax=Ajellomyces capsulatus (strain H88) TaxID=544711 RepID=A0A8A1LZT4_AJEC8|nr:hypothetical protein I7I53_12261 [Histoplasma capsulatum var. duboisii H88]
MFIYILSTISIDVKVHYFPKISVKIFKISSLNRSDILPWHWQFESIFRMKFNIFFYAPGFLPAAIFVFLFSFSLSFFKQYHFPTIHSGILRKEYPLSFLCP